MYEFLAKLPHGTSVSVVLNYGGRVGGINCYTYKVDNNLNLYMQGVYTMKMTECFKSVEKKIDVIIEKNQNNESFVPKFFAIFVTENR